MSKIQKIDTCESCTFFHIIEKREYVFKGYCENPENKTINDGIKKIIINPKYDGAEDRIYPIIDSKYIPKWCKLPNYEVLQIRN